MKDELLARLRPYGQEHLLAFWDELSPDARESLKDQIAAVDCDELAQLFRGHDAAPNWNELALRAEPPRAIRVQERTADQVRNATRSGEALLRAGKVGLILVAGGQGTRLGFDQPKGMFPLGPVSQRTLFQLLIDRLVAIGQKYARPLPMYLMTSPATHAETLKYFTRHGLLGLAPADFQLFCQAVIPALDATTGQILLEAKDRLALSPVGHGGMLEAFASHGCLDHAAMRGIEQLFYIQVDNPLAPIADPELLGHHLESGSEMTTQVVAKTTPMERVGNVVLLDGKTQIIEYSDLPQSVAERRNPDGTLALWAGNIAVHVFRVDFLTEMAHRENPLPFHRALKKCSYIDERGRRIEPETPNGLKFERFIFDLLPHAHRAIAVEAIRQEAFVPVKNASGSASDSPEVAQAAMVALHTRWLQAAGVRVASGVPVEIHPRWALDAQEVVARISAGALPEMQINHPTYLT